MIIRLSVEGSILTVLNLLEVMLSIAWYKFNGIFKHAFYLHLHLKEAEFVFNHRHEDLYKIMLKILQKTI